MKALWNKLIENESGLILSAELVLILTIAVLGLVTGLVCAQQAVVAELQDIGLAWQGLNQSFVTPSFRGCPKWWGRTSWTAGSGFIDIFDGCIGPGCVATTTGVTSGSCDIIGGLANGCCPPQTTAPNTTVLGPPATPNCLPTPSPPDPCDAHSPAGNVVSPTPQPIPQ